MGRLRHLIVQRIVVLLLLLGASAAVAPVAEAAPAGPLEDLRDALGDDAAVDAALDAARLAPTPEAAADAFARTFAAVAGDPSLAREVARLLLDRPNRFGAPPLPTEAAVWKAAASTPTPTDRSASGTLGASVQSARRGAAVEALPHPLLSMPSAHVDAHQQTRAP